MQFSVSESNGTKTTNATLSYTVTSATGGIYDVNFTISSSGGGGTTESYKVDSNNDSVLSATFSGYTIYGSEAKSIFDGSMSLFGLEYTFGGAINVYTSSQYFHSTGTTSMTYGTATFPVTTYVANSLPLSVDECGISSTISAYTLEVGTPTGTSLLFITYLHIETTAPQTEDITFQLVSMTVG